MGHHGHKIDGHVLVLIKSKLPKKSVKAWKGSFLCLFSIAVTIITGGAVAHSTSVRAQSTPVYASRNAGQTEIRLQQMETQIRELTGNVEEQIYEINSLKQKIKRLERTVSEVSAAASQALEQSPSRRSTTGRIGSSHAIGAKQDNPLGLDLSAQQPKGMQTATVIAGNSDATQQYETAYASLKKERYAEAQKGFEGFLGKHRDHILAANAKYWLGETYYVRGDYKKAARVFAEGFQKYPDSAKSPDILLKLGMSLKGMGKDKEACIALGQIPTKFPSGNETVLKRAAEERINLACDA